MSDLSNILNGVVTIRLEDLEQLVRDSLWLNALECAGIDNSEAYDEAERIGDQEVDDTVGFYIRASRG